MRLLDARADELASLVNVNARVLFACRWLVERAPGQEASPALARQTDALLDDVQGISFWIAEPDGATGRVLSSSGSASRLSGRLTPEQWSTVFSTRGGLFVPTVSITEPDGTAAFGYVVRLSGGRVAVTEFHNPDVVGGVIGRESDYEASLYLGTITTAPFRLVSTTPSGTVREPTTQRAFKIDGIPMTLVLGGGIETTPGWLPAAILIAAIIIGLAAAAAVAVLQGKREQLAHHADHDELTGLANRRRFDRTLETLTAGGAAGVILFDLDGFKPINDLLGHASGDVALTVVAERLRAVVPPEALPARLGGDEFMVCTPSIGEGRLEALARAIQEHAAGPVQLGEHLVDIDVSVGMASFPGTSDSPESLLRDADMAMYVAKRNGPGSEPVSYSPSLVPRGPELPQTHWKPSAPRR